MAQSNPNSDDYYAVLGLSRDASKSDVREAYKKAARCHHPDKNPNDRQGAEARFKNVSEAYEVLVDAEKRATYDRFGKEAFQAGGGGGDDPSFSGFKEGGGGIDPSMFSRGNGTRFSFSGPSRSCFRTANEIYAEFFGGLDQSPVDDNLLFNHHGSPRDYKQQDMDGVMRGHGMEMGGNFSGFSMSFEGPGAAANGPRARNLDKMHGDSGPNLTTEAGGDTEGKHSLARRTKETRKLRVSYDLLTT